MTAPVCHISPPVQVGQPPAVPFQSISPIPAQFDWNALRTILNQMKRAIEQLSGQQGNTANNGQKKPNKTGRYIEISRDVEQVTIPIITTGDNPEVTFNQINRLTFKDTVTGEQWQWNRGQ